VFSLAAQYHPLVTEPDQIFERSERETKSSIAAEIGKPWAEIEAALYVDVIDYQPLRTFAGFDSPEALLSRYNLAQLQACLYKARAMFVKASADFAPIVRYAKLARLLVDTRRISPTEYRIDLSGPASVLHETRRYGINFATFVSALVACRGWSMTATVITPWGRDAQLRVTSEYGYRSHVVAPAEFDSEVEAALAKRWGESREGWRLVRDAGILQEGQATFVPDFLLRHEDGREVFLDIVGFWTPVYLASKRKTISLFKSRRILLAIARSTAKDDAESAGVVVYKTRVKPEEVVKAVEAMTAPK
jgi:predicted nuclease of restriction endonuclease-like RecB superfamily